MLKNKHEMWTVGVKTDAIGKWKSIQQQSKVTKQPYPVVFMYEIPPLNDNIGPF